MLISGKMAITPLWKELGKEVIPFSKTTGSELSDEHFMIPSKNDWENWVWIEVGNPTSKIRRKKLNENALFLTPFIFLINNAQLRSM